MVFFLSLLLLFSVGLKVLDDIPLKLLVLFFWEALVVGYLVLEVGTPLLYALNVWVLDHLATDLGLPFHKRFSFWDWKIVGLGKYDLLGVSCLLLVWYYMVLNLKLSEMSAHLMRIELDLLTVHLRKVDAWCILHLLHATYWLNPTNLYRLFNLLKLLSRLLCLLMLILKAADRLPARALW